MSLPFRVGSIWRLHASAGDIYDERLEMFVYIISYRKAAVHALVSTMVVAVLCFHQGNVVLFLWFQVLIFVIYMGSMFVTLRRPGFLDRFSPI